MKLPFRSRRRAQQSPDVDRAIRTPAQLHEALSRIEDARRCAEAGSLRDSTDWTRPRLEIERRAVTGR
jgi:hypothetical protein